MNILGSLSGLVPKSVRQYVSRKFDGALDRFRLVEPLQRILSSDVLTHVIVPQDLLDAVKSLNLQNANEESVFRYIVAVSVFNGILVGLPGTLGWGVLLAQAVELLMAYQIGRMTGLFSFGQTFSPSGLVRMLSGVGVSAVAVTQLFGLALNAVFNTLSTVLPAIMPVSFAAVMITTLFYGLFIYLVFSELAESERNKLSLFDIGRMAKKSYGYTKHLGLTLSTLLKDDAPRFYGELKRSVSDCWYGLTQERGLIRGELFLSACLVGVLTRDEVSLSGPFSQYYLDAWRMANPSKLGPEATIEEISALAGSYDSAQLVTVHQGVTAKFYEILEVEAENYDQDGWTAEISDAQNNPGFDAVFTHASRDTVIEINFKLTDNVNYIESHLAKYPDIPVVAPPEIAEKIDNPLVWAGEYSYDQTHEISADNFDTLLKLDAGQWTAQGGLAMAGLLALTVSIAPYLSAYARKKISASQLREVFVSFLPEIGTRTANRLVMLSVLGPVYAMALTAKIALSIIHDQAVDQEVEETTEREQPTNEESGEPKNYSRRDVITLFWPRGGDSAPST